MPELVTSVGHQQLINCGFVLGVTHNKPSDCHLPVLTWRCIRPLCIAVVMVQDLPGSTQDRLSLQARTFFLFNVLHIFVTSRVGTPRASTHAHYLDALCDPKKRNGKAYVNKTFLRFTNWFVVSLWDITNMLNTQRRETVHPFHLL